MVRRLNSPFMIILCGTIVTRRYGERVGLTHNFPVHVCNWCKWLHLKVMWKLLMHWWWYSSYESTSFHRSSIPVTLNFKKVHFLHAKIGGGFARNSSSLPIPITLLPFRSTCLTYIKLGQDLRIVLIKLYSKSIFLLFLCICYSCLPAAAQWHDSISSSVS